jgi:hypothetical protein
MTLGCHDDTGGEVARHHAREPGTPLRLTKAGSPGAALDASLATGFQKLRASSPTNQLAIAMRETQHWSPS